mmetsp:Transcript_3924/g.9375  ORF Transcript_3924/g.9375 Transcript_3924/m.9375 type:complete len:204 (+) Transcript_3924:996-1607(+)
MRRGAIRNGRPAKGAVVAGRRGAPGRAAARSADGRAGDGPRPPVWLANQPGAGHSHHRGVPLAHGAAAAVPEVQAGVPPASASGCPAGAAPDPEPPLRRCRRRARVRPPRAAEHLGDVAVARLLRHGGLPAVLHCCFSAAAWAVDMVGDPCAGGHRLRAPGAPSVCDGCQEAHLWGVGESGRRLLLDDAHGDSELVRPCHRRY